MEGTASQGSPSTDLRRDPRRVVDVPSGIALYVPQPSGKDRTVMGKLVDVSDGGVGLEAYVPIDKNAIIRIAAELHNGDLTLRMRGRARVVHATRQDDGLYRIGLQFVEVVYARPANAA